MLLNQAQGTDNARLLGLLGLFDVAQATFVAQGNHELGKGLIGDAASELAIERVDRRLAQRVAIDLIDGLEEFLRLEQGAFGLSSISLEPLVSAEASAGGPAELAANGLFFLNNEFDPFTDKLMVPFVPRQGGGIRLACCSLEDGELRFGDAVAVLIYPGQCVVALPSSDVNQHSLRRFLRRLMRAGGVSDRGQVGDDFL